MERYPAASRWAGQQKIFTCPARSPGEQAGLAGSRRHGEGREKLPRCCACPLRHAPGRGILCAMGPRSPRDTSSIPRCEQMPSRCHAKRCATSCQSARRGSAFRSDEYCFRGGQIGQKLGECRQSSAINSARLAGVNRTNQALTRLLDHPGKFDCQLVKVGRDPPNAVTSEGMDVRRGSACTSQHVRKYRRATGSQYLLRSAFREASGWRSSQQGDDFGDEIASRSRFAASASSAVGGSVDRSHNGSESGNFT